MLGHWVRKKGISHYTVVNGEVLLEKGTHTGSYPAACCTTLGIRTVGANRRPAIDHITDHGMTRSVYFLDPDGIMMEFFADAFATEEEGLAYMRSPGRPAAAPMDITAPEPPRPEIAEAGHAKAGT